MAEHDDGVADELRGTIENCDPKIDRCRAALDAGGHPALMPMDQRNHRDQERCADTARPSFGQAARISEDQIGRS
jgi:hypothetical protein